MVSEAGTGGRQDRGQEAEHALCVCVCVYTLAHMHVCTGMHCIYICVHCACKIHLKTEESVSIRFHSICAAAALPPAKGGRGLDGGIQGGFLEEVALNQCHQELKQFATPGL